MLGKKTPDDSLAFASGVKSTEFYMLKKKLAVAGTASILIGTLMLASSASAQSDQRITLKAKTGGTTITGNLLSFDNGAYEIDTNAGAMRIEAAAVTCEGAACPPLFVMDAPVELRSFDGGVTLSGAMRGFADGRFTIRTTSMGTVEIAADLFSCDGPGCPIGM